MLKFLCLLFTVLLVAPVCGQEPTPTQPTPPDWCVRIFVDHKGDRIPEWMGSGALVADDLIVTNWHVISDRKRLGSPVTVMFNDWTFAKDVKVIASSKQWDLALLSIKTTDRKPVEFATDPPEGITGRIHGYGFGSYETGTGRVGGYIIRDDLGTKDKTNNEHDDIRSLHGIGARQGDSGGAVTDDNGKLIGVLNMSNQREKLTVFIVQSQLRKMIAGLPSKYKSLKSRIK